MRSAYAATSSAAATGRMWPPSDARRRLEIWIALEEGLRAADLFIGLNKIRRLKLGEHPELIRQIRQEKREFIVGDAI
jgi:hypothetical protein